MIVKTHFKFQANSMVPPPFAFDLNRGGFGDPESSFCTSTKSKQVSNQ